MRYTVSLVDADPATRLGARALLDAQFDVIEYSDGQSALDGLGIVRPDLMLLAVSLPEIGGTEILQRIRASDGFRHLPVIAFTDDALVAEEARLFAAGFDAYVTKPIVRPSNLFNVIERCLAPRRTSGATASTPALPGRGVR